MASREEKVTAGLFVLVGLVLIIITVAVIAGFRLKRAEKIYFVNFTESVSGLEAESTVTYQGVPAGRVKNIEFTDDVATIRVVLGLDPDLPVKVSAKATLKQHFITNRTIIELIGGTNQDADLPPGSFIEWQETGLMIVQRSVPEMLNKISDSLEAVRTVLAPENVQRFGRIMENLDQTLAEGRVDIDRLSHSSEELLLEIRKAAGEARELVQLSKDSLKRLEADFSTTLKVARGFLDSTRAAMGWVAA
jgi:phospholipid/cholesterol/gamma-HCH transport system substrate-binding protein